MMHKLVLRGNRGSAGAHHSSRALWWLAWWSRNMSSISASTWSGTVQGMGRRMSAGMQGSQAGSSLTPCDAQSPKLAPRRSSLMQPHVQPSCQPYERPSCQPCERPSLLPCERPLRLPCEQPLCQPHSTGCAGPNRPYIAALISCAGITPRPALWPQALRRMKVGHCAARNRRPHLEPAVEHFHARLQLLHIQGRRPSPQPHVNACSRVGLAPASCMHGSERQAARV